MEARRMGRWLLWNSTGHESQPWCLNPIRASTMPSTREYKGLRVREHVAYSLAGSRQGSLHTGSHGPDAHGRSQQYVSLEHVAEVARGLLGHAPQWRWRRACGSAQERDQVATIHAPDARDTAL